MHPFSPRFTPFHPVSPCFTPFHPVSPLFTPFHHLSHGLTCSVLFALIPIAEPIGLRYPLRHALTAPIRPGHSPQRHKWSRVLAREPDTSLRAALPQRFNVPVQLHLPVLFRIAGLERRVRAEACELVVLPIRDEDPGRFALGGRGGIVGQERVVGLEEGVEAREVFLGSWIEALDQGGDVLSAGSMEVEQERWVRARSGEGGERDTFCSPAFRILL